MSKRESSLTTPSDRDPENKAGLDLHAPPLTEEQTKEAMKCLNDNSFVENFPRVERRYQDPPVDLQTYFLVSFIPSKGATPNSDGIYGFAKVRGCFATEQEANARSEFLVKNVDSYHKIFHGYVGRPFPITNVSTFSKEVFQVDLQKSVSEAVSEDVRKKREKEQQEIAEIEQKQKELLEDVKKDEEVQDKYTTLRVKKAQLSWTYVETEKKMKQMRILIAKARKEIEDLEAKDGELKKSYYDRYINARKQAGLKVEKSNEDNFMKFLVEDLSLPEIDAEYEKLFGKESSV